MNNSSCAIDSASLVLPLSNVTLLCSDLKLLANTHESEYLLMHAETGEVFNYDLVKRNPSVTHDDGITTTYYKLLNTNVGAKDFRQCIAININSKMLRAAYLRGITNETVTYLYAEIMQQNKIRCSLDSFMSGFLTDIDIKKDYALSDKYDDFNHLASSIGDAAKDEYKKTNSVTKFNTKDNQGVQFSYRGNGSGMPYFKIYNKALELDTKSKDFKKAYNIDCTEIVRFEATLKNRKQMQDFGLISKEDRQTLKNILSKLGEFDMRKIVSLYTNGIVPIDKKLVSDFKQMQKIEMQAFKIAVKLLVLSEKANTALNEVELINEVNELLMPSKNNVSRCKLAIEQAFSDFYAENEQFDDIFDFMG